MPPVWAGAVRVLTAAVETASVRGGMLGTARFCSRFLLVLALTLSSSLAFAQGDGAAAGPTKEDLEKAKTLAQEGATAEQNGELQVAIEKYKEAYELFPDPNLLIKLGDTYRKNANNDEAVTAWKKYISSIGETCGRFDEATCVKIDQQQGACIPKYGEAEAEAEEAQGAFEGCVGRYLGPIEERVKTVETELAEKAEKEKQDAERVAKEAEERKKAEEEAKRVEASKMPMALNAMVVIGADQNSTVIGRLLAGGMLRFGRFAPEAHIAFEGFLRANSDKGTQAQSFTLLDLGARYAFKDEQFVGPFVAMGGGFGLFLGTPRDINLTGDATSCAGFDNNDCTIQVDKHLNGRLGFGYGFKSGEKATVAVRLDLGAWWYSVDTEQPGGVPVGQIELPQIAYALTLGLEFLRWR